MRKIILSLLSIILFCNFGIAQNKLSGKIENAANTEALAGANIKIIELNIGTTSNAEGNYQFVNLANGSYQLEVSYIGFETKRLTIHINQNTEKNIQLFPTVVELQTAVITATLTNLNKVDVPAKADIITKEQIADYPATSFDDLFRAIPNLVVNRSSGMFSKNSSVTMRGMDASASTLVLVNGTPMNKTAGGTIIWDMINPESVERVEIIKGPGSAIYGNNAMGGVINIITKTPENQKIEGSVSAFAGTYNLFGGNLNLGQKSDLGNNKIFWQLHSNYTKGDGYILAPEETRSEYDTKAYVDEFSLNLKSGLEFKDMQKLTFEYSYYDGKHGSGTKVQEENGAYDQYYSNLLSAKYFANLDGFKINANLFTQWQDENGITEKINTKGEYKFTKSYTDTKDYGLFFNVSKQLKSHRLLAGVDLKNGNMDGSEIYMTSTDRLDYKGEMFFYGLFLQDEISLIENKLQTIVGFRLDHANFSDASLDVIDPTKETGFVEAGLINFAENSWSEFSPKISLLWKHTEQSSLYTSFSTGFMPPKLDDMVRSGTVTKGFKVANPELKPETITNAEIGGKFLIAKKLEFEPAAYYSWAKDMVYFIATGEKITTSGNKKQDVLQKRNISKAEIYGFESSLNYSFSKQLNFMIAYTYNHSTIKEFYDANTVQDFEGKFLIEVPKHQFSFSAYWKNKIVNISVVYNYMDRQWYDDLNTEFIKSYHTVDLKLCKTITKNLSANLTIQNLLDDAFIDRKGLLSPGRFILFDVKYNF